MICAPLTIYYSYYYEIKINKKIHFGHILLVNNTLINGIVSVATPIVILLRQSTFLGAFYTLEEVDKLFKKFEIHFSCRYLHYFTIGITLASGIGTFVNHIYYTTIENKPQLQQLMETLNYISGYILRQWPVYYYVCFLIVLTVRMWYLNNLISKWNLREMSKQEIDRSMMLVAKLHWKICHVSNCLNITYSLSMLGNILLTSSLMIMAVLTFFGLNVQRQNEILYWASFNIYPTWGIIILCHYSTYKVC